MDSLAVQNRFMSLLYPSLESYEYHLVRENLPKISDEVCRELGLDGLFDLKNASLTEFFTSDPEVIKYRQQTITDMINLPELKGMLAQITPMLDDIRERRRLDRDRGTTAADSYLYSITEVELYVACIEEMRQGFAKVSGEITSPAFRALSDFAALLADSDYYVQLKKKLEELSSKVSEVKSVTIGVNLDREMRPCSAGVISVNSQEFKSGKVLDKILRFSFKNDAFTCISELSPFGKGQSDNKREALVGAFNAAIEDVFRSSVKGWRIIVGDYVLENTDFLLKLLPEIEFVTRASEAITSLASHEGCSVVLPTVADASEKAFSAKALYNPRVALAIDDDIVTNDFEFDKNAGIYVLSGPNRGGKSVITVALGAAQALFQLGLYVPAKSAVISPVDGIFTHFPEGADDTIDKGRLGEECARLKEIFESVSDKSMILLDESLSSTGSYEASYIAAEMLSGFAVIGCRGIFSTHLHELAASIPEINERSSERGGVKLDTLVAGIEDGKRSFKIHRMKPDGKSYARDIAEKYGLTFDKLIGKAKKEI